MEVPVFDANSVDTDQTPRYAASDQGLHCLPMFLSWGARLKCITTSWSINKVQPTGRMVYILVNDGKSRSNCKLKLTWRK